MTHCVNDLSMTQCLVDGISLSALVMEMTQCVCEKDVLLRV